MRVGLTSALSLHQRYLMQITAESTCSTEIMEPRKEGTRLYFKHLSLVRYCTKGEKKVISWTVLDPGTDIQRKECRERLEEQQCLDQAHPVCQEPHTTLTCFSHLTIFKNLPYMTSHSHFTNQGENELKRHWGTCPQLHSEWLEAGLGFHQAASRQGSRSLLLSSGRAVEPIVSFCLSHCTPPRRLRLPWHRSPFCHSQKSFSDLSGASLHLTSPCMPPHWILSRKGPLSKLSDPWAWCHPKGGPVFSDAL